MNNKLDPLSELAIKHGTDKYGSHFYTPHYHKHFEHVRLAPINLLEIGIGGYDDPCKGGESLRMWQEYFPNGMIYGIDIADKSGHESDRIKTFRGSQIDHEFLDHVFNEIGRVDIIIDDGSHVNSHVIDTFKHLYPKLDDSGVYVVEDLQTSYWESYGGSSFCLDRQRTAINFFKSCLDSMNYMEFVNPRYTPTYFDKHIVSMSWYHNMVFVQKGVNDEKSNLVNDNRLWGQAESTFDYYRRRLQSIITGLLPPKW